MKICSLVIALCSIATASMISTPVWASQQDLTAVDEPALDLHANPAQALIHQKNIYDFVDTYILKQIFSYPGVVRKASGVCHLWEKLLMDHGTTAIIHFRNIDDLLSYPLSCYPKSRFKISCDVSTAVLTQFVQRVPTIKDLDLSNNKSITDVTALGHVHTLNLTGTIVTKVSALGKVYDLDLYGTNVTDVSALGQVHTLHLCGTNVTDVSALGQVHALHLYETNVTDVSALGHVHTLNLERTNVTDVSTLGHVHTLDLSWTNVIDVSALGHIHTLNLTGTEVTDVSALGHVHTLHLGDTKVTDVSALSHVHTLDLTGTNVTDVSTLNYVSHLTLPSGEVVRRN